MLSILLRCVSVGLISAVAIAPTLGAQNAKAEKITLEDLLAVEPLGAPVLTTDGTQFAIIRNERIALTPFPAKRSEGETMRRRQSERIMGDEQKGRSSEAVRGETEMRPGVVSLSVKRII